MRQKIREVGEVVTERGERENEGGERRLMSYGESQREKQNALHFARSANVFSQRLTRSSFLKGAAALTKGLR